MLGDLTINGKDAYQQWGISLEDTTAISALMTPAGVKEYITTQSRIEHGQRMVVGKPKLEARTITLPLNLTARTRDEFLRRYSSFCTELEGGTLNISTRWQPGVVYKTLYQSCTQFSEFMFGIGKIQLKLIEPNPKDRTEPNSEDRNLR